jgi:hypothetical protein
MAKGRSHMTPAAVARIQRATCLANGGTTPAGSFPARAQAAVARGTSTPKSPGGQGGGAPSGPSK